jgi:hypothetical protein
MFVRQLGSKFSPLAHLWELGLQNPGQQTPQDFPRQPRPLGGIPHPGLCAPCLFGNQGIEILGYKK